MASKYFLGYRRQQDAKNHILVHQKAMIDARFSFLQTAVRKNILTCSGWITSPLYKHKYKVEITCVVGYEPYCKIVEPADIKPCQEIHMHDDHSLCLSYPEDMKWTSWTPIYQYTIPWLVEWPLYYEIFLLNGGKWEGPESPVHFTEQDKNKDCDQEIENLVAD